MKQDFPLLCNDEDDVLVDVSRDIDEVRGYASMKIGCRSE